MGNIVLILLIIIIIQMGKLIIDIDRQKKIKINLIIDIFFILTTIVIEWIIIAEGIDDLTHDFYVNLPIFTIIYSVLNIAMFLHTFLKRKKTDIVNESSIKKAIDYSEYGILILDKYGRIVIQNEVVRKILQKLNIDSNYVENIKNKSFDNVDKIYFIKINDIIYGINISDDECEMVFADITSEYMLNKELEEQTQKIQENNETIMETIENIEIIEKEKNLRKLKNKFHDLFGYKLSLLHQYLINSDNENIEFNEMKSIIQKMFNELGNENDPYDSLNNIIKTYGNIGVKININKELPKNYKIAKTFFEIIREAVTNAIIHAQSREINITINENVEKIEMNIVNNGTKPQQVIEEHEGIKGMRRKVAELKGNIEIDTKEKFTINVIIPII